MQKLIDFGILEFLTKDDNFMEKPTATVVERMMEESKGRVDLYKR